MVDTIKKILLFVLLSGGCIPSIYAVDSAANNLEVFKSLVEQSTDQLINNASLSLDDILILDSQSDDRLSMFIDVWMMGQLKKNGFDSIYVKSPANQAMKRHSNKSKRSVVLTYSVVEFDLKYKGERTFWRNKSVGRYFSSDLLFNISNSDGYAQWNGHIKKSYQDYVLPAVLKKLENENVDFTQSKLPPKPVFKKYIEPLFVIGVTGTVIYLFYALRSK